MPRSLPELRQAIDSLDAELLQRINDRAALAVEVAQAKQAAGDNDFYRPEREAQILRKVQQDNPGPLGDAAVAGLFREIMSACLALEQPLSVAFLGPRGTFTEMAARKHFGTAVSFESVGSIPEVFREVAAGQAQYGVVPIENSTEGVVTHTLDTFMNSALKICGEIKVPIHHCLLSKETDLKAVKEVFSHQQSLAQCRLWLQDHLPEVSLTPVASNAEAAKRASEVPGTAAIAGETAASLYGLSSLAKNIEDDAGNTTRFLVIGDQEIGPSGDDKTSLMLAADNRAGALHELLLPFANYDVSMTRIESRPSRKAVWEYVFFVDVLGHAEDDSVTAALDELRNKASMVKLLGSYPAAAF